MRLVLCDENRILCDALAAQLTSYGHEVVGVATTASGAVRAVAEHHPDGCVLDIRFGGAPDGIAAMRSIRRSKLGTKVVVLSAVTEPSLVARALQAGAVGFLRKDQDVGQIVEALHAVAAGEVVIHTAPRWARHRAAATPLEQTLHGLPHREMEVLRRIVAGQDTAQMAREMRISTSTLQSYVKSILAKLGAHSRLEAAALASRDGLIAHLPPTWATASPAQRSGPGQRFPPH